MKKADGGISPLADPGAPPDNTGNFKRSACSIPCVAFSITVSARVSSTLKFSRWSTLKFIRGLYLAQRGLEINQGFGHLLRIATRGKLGLGKQTHGAREVLNRLLAASLEFHLAAARFLQA